MDSVYNIVKGKEAVSIHVHCNKEILTHMPRKKDWKKTEFLIEYNITYYNIYLLFQFDDNEVTLILS